MSVVTLLERVWNNSRHQNGNYWRLAASGPNAVVCEYAVLVDSSDEDDWADGRASFTRAGFATCMRELLKNGRSELHEREGVISFTLQEGRLIVLLRGNEIRSWAQEFTESFEGLFVHFGLTM